MKNISAVLIFSAFILALFINFSCSKKITVEHISKIVDKEQTSGIFYALPQTVVTVDVKVTKTENIKGPYFAFAGKFLGLNNVITSNNATYEISDIAIGHYVEPDPEHYYLIKSTNKSLLNQSVIINLSESGLLKSINDKNEWTDIEKTNYTFTDKEANISGETFNYLVNANLFEKVDTIIEKIHLDTITIEKQTLKISVVEKDVEKKAQDVADYILKIKEKKLNIISGFTEVAYDKNTLEYMYSELDKLEKEYLLLFTGIKVTKTNTYRFTYLPKTTETEQLVPLFNFSVKDGLLDSASNKGDEFQLLINRKGSTQPLKDLLNNKIENKRNGIYYRIPEYGKVSLISKDKVKAEASIIINQFGVISQLKPSRIQLQFYPNSGSIKSIGVEK